MKILIIVAVVVFVLCVLAAAWCVWELKNAHEVIHDGEHEEFRRNLEKER